MRRIEPAYPDLLPVTHVLRPGYLPGKKVTLDPIRGRVLWEDAPVRILPAEASIPREPVRAMIFARVAVQRREILHRFLERGGFALVVLFDPAFHFGGGAGEGEETEDGAPGVRVPGSGDLQTLAQRVGQDRQHHGHARGLVEPVQTEVTRHHAG